MYTNWPLLCWMFKIQQWTASNVNIKEKKQKKQNHEVQELKLLYKSGETCLGKHRLIPLRVCQVWSAGARKENGSWLPANRLELPPPSSILSCQESERHTV